jgi:hypothetical protein
MFLAVSCIDATNHASTSGGPAGGFDYGGNLGSDEVDERGRVTGRSLGRERRTHAVRPGTEQADQAGTLTAETVVQGVKQGLRNLKPCIEQAQADGVLTPGKYRLLLAWSILPDGSVDAARVDEPVQIRTAPLGGCISAGMMSWRFPASEHGVPVRKIPLPFSIR